MNQGKRITTAISASLFAALLLGGCGSGNKEGATLGGSALFGGVPTVGDTVCTQCHSSTTDPVNGQTLVFEYQTNSPHNQAGLGCESCHGGGAGHNGVGPIPYPLAGGPDQVAARCATCHDGKTTLILGGVATVAPLSNSASAFNSSVHASGISGTGPSNSRNSAPCFRCHTNEGAILSDQYGLTGQKGTSSTYYANNTLTGIMDDPNYQAAVPLAANYNAITCDTCHAHGGGLRPVTTRDVNGNIVTWNPDPANVPNANDQFNLCTSCHNMIANDKKTVMASGDAVLGVNAYNGNPTTSTQTIPIGHHQDDWYRTIATSHNDNTDNTTYGINGYVLRTKATKVMDPATGTYTTRTATPCFDCHGHESRTNTGLVASGISGTTTTAGGSTFYNSNSATIYTDWSQSAHAGFMLSQKLAAVQGQSGTAATDAALNGNSQEPPFGGDGASSHDFSTAGSQACQRCHTSTGAANYLTGTVNYDPTQNDFSNLAGWKASSPSSKQREMIYCWACHSNAANGVLRTPGAITTNRKEDKDASGNYTYTFKGSPVAFPDVQASNTCVSCHSGRTSGDYIANSSANFSKLGFQNSHYMAAAGLMYVKAGFTAFTDPGTTVPGTSTTYGSSLTSTDDGGSISSTHRVFGSSALIGNHGITSSNTNMLSNGPCVTCHMNDGGGKTKHTLEIDAYAYDQVCVKCHSTEGSKTGPVSLTDTNFQANFVQPNAEAMQGALTLAQTVLSQGYQISYNPDSYPYFFDQSNGNAAVKDWTRGGKLSQADAKKLMGACFNINLLTREPAAYAHARTYTRRLIYDTIDWLDDRTMNLSVGATALAVDPTDFQKGTNAYTDGTLGTIDPNTSEAMLFLISWSRSTGKWSTVERP